MQPRIVTFFLLVFVFWYWVGVRVESWRAAKATDPAHEKPNRAYVLYALLGGLVDIGCLRHRVGFCIRGASSWYSLRYLYGDWELLHVTQFLWSVVLAGYYFRRLARGFHVSPMA